MSDPINPSHYKHLPVEAIDIIEAAIAKAPSNKAAYLQGQVLKYLLRCWEKKGIEDLRKAKWYLDRLIGSFDDLLAEINAPILEGAIEQPKPLKTQPPTGYRLLGDAKDEPRIEGDQYWSIAIKGWTVLTSHKVEYANQHDWLACRKIDPPPKRYREPTLADLKDGPIDCEVRNSDGERWVWRILCGIVDKSDRPFRVLKDRLMDSKAKWPQCRIEVK